MIAFLLAVSIFIDHGAWSVQAPVPPVPDAAPAAPHDIAVRLQERYEEDPSSAIGLARRLGGMSDPLAQQIFVEWVHNRLALDFAPVTIDRAKTPAHAAFLAALVEPGDPNGPMAVATAAMRMWAAAQQTTDPRRLRALAVQSFPSPASYGARYQLLLANRLEALPSLSGEGRELRARLIVTLLDRLERAEDAPVGRLRYWLAYALDRQADALVPIVDAATPLSAERLAGWVEISGNRLNAVALTSTSGSLLAKRPPLLGAPQNGADAPSSTRVFRAIQFTDPDPTEAEWFREQAMLGGRTEFVTPYADDLESQAKRAESRGDAGMAETLRAQMWQRRLILARMSPEALATCEADWTAAHPGERFNLFLAHSHRGGRLMPEGTVDRLLPDEEPIDMRSLRGRWRLLYVWSTGCSGCEAELALVDALSRDFPDAVLALAAHGDREQVRAYLGDRVLAVPAAAASDAIVVQLGATALPARLIVSPDGLVFRLELRTWEPEARRILSLNRDR